MRAPGRRDFVTISLGSLVSMTMGPGRAVAAAEEGPPALLNATWDWGAGDFETALGAASHMGSRENVGGFLARGARLDLFCAAMMGMLDVVRPVVDAYPGAIGWLGPHGIPLLRHAVAGESDEVVDFLRSKGAV